MIYYCFKCSAELEIDDQNPVSRQETCFKCHSSVHCCKMCVHYDEIAYNQCRESSADRVVDKEKANFCDFFHLNKAKKDGSNLDNILAKANSLFKK